MKQLDCQDKEKISEIVEQSVDDISDEVNVSNRYFDANHGLSGSVFRKSDSILVDDGDNTFVLRITEFFSVSLINGYMLFCKGDQFDFIRDANGEMETNFWTGFSHVPPNPSFAGYFIKTDRILRKVLLFKINNSLSLLPITNESIRIYILR